MVDASWEPDEVFIAPHRRSVPLTLEQVQAQLPPQEPLPDSSDDYEIGDYGHDAFGRYKRHLGMYGPALACLTANQAINLLQDKPMLCWLDSDQGNVSKYSTVQERMQELHQMTFSGLSVEWPPQEREVIDDASLFGSYHFYGECLTPAEVRTLRPQRAPYYAQQPYPVHVSPGWMQQLLSTTQTSCKSATKEEQQHFFTSTTASDADSFDMHLAVGCEFAPLYVFLDPTRRRFTGCLKTHAAAAASSAAAATTGSDAVEPAKGQS